MDDGPFFVANGPIIAMTIFIIISMGCLCSTMKGMWVVSAYALSSVMISNVYIMTFVSMHRLENSDSARVDWITNAYIIRYALTLMHAYPLLCIAHLSKYRATQFCIMFGLLMMCIIKPIDTACVSAYIYKDVMTFNFYGLLVDILCILISMSFILYDIPVILQNTSGVCLYSVVFVLQVTGSCLLNTHFKDCNTFVTLYTRIMGISIELILFCYMLLMTSSQVNYIIHCKWCSACKSNGMCMSCTSCNGFATVKEWKDGDIVIATLYSTELISEMEVIENDNIQSSREAA
jgi:hypothetical protein